jgi:hypothetical protein
MDFKDQLRMHLQLLEDSCTRYDGGDREEGWRVATLLRTLFHEPPGSSASVLTYLRTYNFKLLSTCEIIPVGVEFWANLTVISQALAEGWIEYAPKLHAASDRHLVSTDQWRKQETVYLVGSLAINRMDLILSASRKNDGRYQANKHNSPYEAILSEAGRKMTSSLPNQNQNLDCSHGHLAALRQMGYEVLLSPDFAELVPARL